MIQKLNLPISNLKLTKNEQGQIFVWCIIRKKKLVLTPEEWVRQHVIHFLINEKKVPESLIASEVELQINGLKRRCDILVFSQDKKPLLVVECKAPEVDLSQSTLFQIAQYNSVLNCPYLFISNGLSHFCFNIDLKNHQFQTINELPSFNQLITL